MIQDNTIDTTKPLRKSDIAIRCVDNEAILYREGEKRIHILNPTARLVWELCDGAHTVEDMEKTMRANFSIADGRDVMKDIRQTIDEFACKGVLEGKKG
ncbi:MAG: PqqD family protein [Planctomycetia bacterium]|nr:MAG: PqqD family protein [Planctomycetia bacterium]TVL96878.1 MAG: hypothetical protein CV082_05655 [Candidatus Brocadia sp. BL1]GJQ24909.1 MAG: hypothetical protein HBSAPP01_26990 [Candidatus Brocadia sapporoensis]HQU32643.1 PqqD family protein [Candidatus Brocadia sapporoensis]